MQTTFGEILAGTIAVAKARMGVLAGMWFTYLGVQILFYGIFMGVMGTSVLAAGLAGDANFAASMGAGVILLMLIFYAVYFYIISAQAVSMGILASPVLEPRFGEALTGGFRGGVTMLGVYVLLIIAMIVGAIVFGIAAAIVALLGEIGALISTIAMVAIFVYLACRLLIVAVVIGVDEIRNPITAIRRSWSLTRGNVLAIFLSLLAMIVLTLVVFLVPFALFFGTLTGLAELSADGFAGAMGGSVILLVLVFLALTVVLSVINSALMSTIHANVSDTQTAALEETFG